MAAQIKVEREFDSTIRLIVEKNKIFSKRTQFLTFCAHYGFYTNKTLKVSSDGIDINMRALEDFNPDILAIALAEKENIDILKDEKEYLKIFENYMNGGLKAIHKIIQKNLSTDDDGIRIILDLLHELRNEISDIEDIEKNLELPDN